MTTIKSQNQLSRMNYMNHTWTIKQRAALAVICVAALFLMLLQLLDAVAEDDAEVA